MITSTRKIYILHTLYFYKAKQKRNYVLGRENVKSGASPDLGLITKTADLWGYRKFIVVFL